MNQNPLHTVVATLKGKGMLSTERVSITRFATESGDAYIRVLNNTQLSPSTSVLLVSPAVNGLNQSSWMSTTTATVRRAHKNTAPANWRSNGFRSLQNLAYMPIQSKQIGMPVKLQTKLCNLPGVTQV
eukprot:CAMPEP_0183404118 /NCGR_PEP_ID=MMETSP0370-20130417/14984_1 /TAXON_ID=268820 /ORGANISM="Peridinium aciculiferum, Strain PAER-2" /LENGTH=127 /DNA_ID=CAMNT_0025585939 /DNA_START=409 /DNA_END=792 /DNA_ORIENTATION=+